MFRLMNVVTQCWTWLVPKWVTIFGRVNQLGAKQGTQAYSAWACPLYRLEWVPGESWGSKQAYRVTHRPTLVVLEFADCLAVGLASGDQHLWFVLDWHFINLFTYLLTGSGSASAAWRDDVLYKYTVTLLLLF